MESARTSPAPFIDLLRDLEGRWRVRFEVAAGRPWLGEFVAETPRRAVDLAIAALGTRACGLDRALDEVIRLEQEASLARPVGRELRSTG